ncbi:uncharacterized protein METZ01_LOCUS282727, partial [marine metagenome]
MAENDLEATTTVPGETDDLTEVVQVRGLVKVFKDFWGRPKAKAVNDVDFEVR